MKHNITARNNITIRGTGKQKIIFAHGFGSDQTAWRFVLEQFPGDYTYILFDHVGAGKSDFSAYSPHRYSTIESYSEDLIEICDELNIRNVPIVGHSVGAMISLLASIRRPELFSRLVFVGASPRYLNDTNYVGGFEQAHLDGLFAAMATNYQAWAAGFAPAAMGNPERPELADEFASTLSAIRPDIAISVAKVIFQSDYRSELHKLKAPSLIIQSSEDIAVPMEVGEYLHKNIPGSRLVNVRARGHFPHISAPGEVRAAILPFLEGTR